MFVLCKQKQISMWFRIAPSFASLSTNLAPEQSIRVRRITSKALGALAVVNSGSRCGTCWPRGSFVSVPSPKGVNWRAPTMHPLPLNIYKTPAIPSQKECIFLAVDNESTFIAPCAHKFARPWPSMCPARWGCSEESNQKSKSCVAAWKNQIIHGGGDIASARSAVGGAGSLALGCFAPCETCSVGRVASAKRNKKVPKTSFFTFVGRFIGRIIQLPLKLCAVTRRL